MEYYKMDEEELQIRRIKDLKSIYSIYVKSKNMLILSCTTETDTITFDSQHPYFTLFLSTLATTYFHEVSYRNILCTDQHILSLLEANRNSHEKKKSKREIEKIEYVKYDIAIITPFLYETLGALLGSNGIQVTKFGAIKGMRRFFHLIIETQGNTLLLPFTYLKKNPYSYHIEMGNVLGNSIQIDISFSIEQIKIHFNGSTFPVSGSIEYIIKEDVIHQVSMYYGNKMSYFNRENIEKNEKGNYFLFPTVQVITNHQENIKDTTYVMETKEYKKSFNFYEKSTWIDQIECPYYSKEIERDEYKISDDLTVIQENVVENKNDQEDISITVQTSDREYTPHPTYLGEIKSLDETVIRLCLERSIV